MSFSHKCSDEWFHEWRAMTPQDIPAVYALQAQIHALLPEREKIFAEKLALFPKGCFVFEGPEGLAGYAFAHPFPAGQIAPLDDFLGEIPKNADCLYLHDAAVAPAARGERAADRLIARLRDLARTEHLKALTLVSVYGTGRLWRRFGFAEAAAPGFAQKLSAYGDGAIFMRAPAS